MGTGIRQPGLKADNSHATGSEVKVSAAADLMLVTNWQNTFYFSCQLI
jgi:hypothetical protein